MRLAYKNLPYKRELPYIESTGTQYINTGVIPTNNTKIELSGIFPFTDGHTYLAGSRTDWGSSDLFCMFRNSGTVVFQFSNGGSNNVPCAEDEVILTLSKEGKYINGVKMSDSSQTAFTGTYSIALFAVNSGAKGIEYGSGHKIKYTKIWENDTLVRDFIPVIDSYDVLCLYDKVTKQCYYNAGTGTFKYGGDIPCEWISYPTGSTTTDYLISLAKFADMNKIEYTFKSSSTSGTDIFLGAKYDTTGWLGFGGSLYPQMTASGSSGTTPTLTTTTDSGTQATNTLKANGLKQTWTFTYNKNQVGVTQPFTIGGYSPTNYCTAKQIYEIKCYLNDVVVYDFVPILRNGVIGMYDKVNDTFASNTGTGDFGYEIKKTIKPYICYQATPYKCEVEYLKSSGTQYINTGITAETLPIDIEIEFEYAGLNAYANIVSAQGNSYDYAIFRSSSTGTSFQWVVGSWSSSLGNIEVGHKYNAKIHYESGNSYINIDGNTTICTGALSEFNRIFTIFAMSTGGYKANNLKIYKCTIETPSITKTFIPVLDNSNVPCLYDKSNNEYKYNAGTGTFTYGREIHYAEYLQSTGTQYIDTGVYASDTLKNELTCELTSTASAQMIGIIGDNTSERFHYAFRDGNTDVFGYKNLFAIITTQTEVNVKHTYGFDCINKTAWRDDTSISIASGSGTLPTALTFWLFGRNSSSSAWVRYISAKIYGCKFWDNEVLIKNYLPAYDENGVGFMFDTVTHSIYDNAGTGSFLYTASPSTGSGKVKLIYSGN